MMEKCFFLEIKNPIWVSIFFFLRESISVLRNKINFLSDKTFLETSIHYHILVPIMKQNANLVPFLRKLIYSS